MKRMLMKNQIEMEVEAALEQYRNQDTRAGDPRSLQSFLWEIITNHPIPDDVNVAKGGAIRQRDIDEAQIDTLKVRDEGHRITFPEYFQDLAINALAERADSLGLLTKGDEIGSVKGYETLETVLKMAYQQAACGKGKERHAGDSIPFDRQPMQTESDALGSVDGLMFQVRKKMREGAGMPQQNRRLKEWTGALVYIAGAIIWDLRNRSDEHV